MRDACPFYLQDNEHTTHILYCQHTAALDIWQSAMEKFCWKLEKLHTELCLLEALLNDLDACRNNLQLPYLHNLPDNLQVVFKDLREISYDHVLEGLLPKTFISYQETIFREYEQCSHSGSCWGQKVYKKHAGPLSKKFGQGEMNTSTTQPAFKNYKVDLLWYKQSKTSIS